MGHPPALSAPSHVSPKLSPAAARAGHRRYLPEPATQPPKTPPPKGESHMRWLSNVDKHRKVHVVGRTVFDTGPTLIKASTPIEVVDESRHEGAAEDGTVVARLKFKRPEAGEPIDLAPTFAHIASIQISEGPREYRSLASAVQVTREDVLKVLSLFTDRLGVDFPDHDGLELGEEHEAYAPEAGGLYR